MAARPDAESRRPADLRPAAIATAALCVVILALVLHALPEVTAVIRPTPALAAEIGAAITGVAGAWLLASKGERAGWGFVAYLTSNCGWILFAWLGQHWFMLLQQVAFTAASLYGIWVWLVLPWLDTLVDQVLQEGGPW